MRFAFNERKTAQAAAHLIQRHGGRLNYLVLIKLLYLADRRCLLEAGQPITGDWMVSMPYGPVLSRVLNLINTGTPAKASEWYTYITEPTSYEVALARIDPDTDELSRFELRVLEEIDSAFGSLDKWELVELTHTLPEWVDPERSSLPIEPETILRAEGKSPEEIERIVHDAEEIRFLRALDPIA